ncbi:MAG TPA: universal stress protein [Methylocella sp.]|nr:universal stress protein [Methylocella sp.]
MPIKSVWLGLNFEEAALDNTEESYASENYAVELCAREQAHLSVFLAAPVFKIPGVIPGAGLFPMANAPALEVNTNRRVRAEEAQRRIANAVTKAGVAAEFGIAQESYPLLREYFVASARPSDVIIIPRSGYYLSFDRNMTEAMLFTSGRPMIIVPPDWAQGARFEKIIIAWDGGGRAARAIGDAMPLLRRADQVDIVCIASDGSKTIPRAGLTAHLKRHCKKVVAVDLHMQHGGIAETLRSHARLERANLLVMGAYAHPRMLEIVIGGVTTDMLSDAEIPLFLAH